MSIEFDDVAKKLSDMNTLACVRSILTNGHIMARNDDQLRIAVSEIIRLCVEQECRLYRGYDTLSRDFEKESNR
jgi:hypothetical protein